jgi:hypothetical protein
MNAAMLNRIEDTLAVEPKNPYALNELRTAQSNNKQIKKLVKAIRRQRVWIAAREAKMDVMRDELKDLLEASGHNWKDDLGYANLVPDSTHVSYKAQQLDQLIAREPDLYGCLSVYRTESKIRGSVQVK